MISDGPDIEPSPGWVFCIRSLVEAVGRHPISVDGAVLSHLERFLGYLEIQDYPMPALVRTYNNKLAEVIWCSGRRLMSIQSSADRIWIEVGSGGSPRRPLRGHVDRGRVAFRWLQEGGRLPR
jgi:hypothetical protein